MAPLLRQSANSVQKEYPPGLQSLHLSHTCRFYGIKAGGLKTFCLLAVLFLLSGCVYLRLSRALVQLKYPEENLGIEEKDGTMYLKLLNPMVQTGDLSALFGVPPKKTGERQYQYTFSKKGASDRLPWDINMWADDKDRISRMEVPPMVYRIFGKETILDGIRALGYSTASIRKRTLYLSMTRCVSMADVEELMGKPPVSSGEKRVYAFDYAGSVLRISFSGNNLLRMAVLESGANTVEITCPESSGMAPAETEALSRRGQGR